MRNMIVKFVFLSLFSLVSVYASDNVGEYDLPVAEESLFHIFRGAIYLYEDVEVPSEFTIPSYVRGEKVTDFDIHAFGGFEEIEKVVIPYGFRSIGWRAFENCTNLKWVYIPDSVRYIEMNVFYNCTSLRSIDLPSSIIGIRSNAFYGCTSLKNIYIPASVVKIAGTTFCCCTNLNDIVVDEQNKYYSSAGGVLYNKDKTEIISYAGSELEIGFLPSVRKIGEFAFYKRKDLEIITIPEGIVIIDRAAFGRCSKLKEVHISDSIGYIAERVFEDCVNLELVNIPNSMRVIEISLFDGCTNLKEIVIPLSINQIKDYAFSNCTSLMDIYYEGTRVLWYTIEKGKKWHENVPATVVHCIDGDVPII